MKIDNTEQARTSAKLSEAERLFPNPFIVTKKDTTFIQNKLGMFVFFNETSFPEHIAGRINAEWEVVENEPLLLTE